MEAGRIEIVVHGNGQVTFEHSDNMSDMAMYGFLKTIIESMPQSHAMAFVQANVDKVAVAPALSVVKH